MNTLHYLFVASALAMLCCVQHSHGQWQQAGSVGVALVENNPASANEYGEGLLVALPTRPHILRFKETSNEWTHANSLPSDIISRNVGPTFYIFGNDGSVYLSYGFVVGHSEARRKVQRWVWSNDSGATFAEIHPPIDYFNVKFDFTVFDNGTIVGKDFPRTYGDTTSPNRVLYSTNHGHSWQELDFPHDDFPVVRFNPIGSIEARHSNNTWYRTFDFGRSWEAIDTASTPFGIVNAGRNIRYAFERDGKRANAFRSTDSGRTFQRLDIEHLNSLPSQSSATSLHRAKIGTLVVVTDVSGYQLFHVSSDTGTSFRPLPENVATDILEIHVHNPATLSLRRYDEDYRTESFWLSSDTGTTWNRIITVDAESVSLSVATKDYLYIFTTSGLVRQVALATGESRYIQQGLPEATFTSLVQFNHHGEDHLLGTTGYAGIVAASTDGGLSFTVLQDNVADVKRMWDGTDVLITPASANHNVVTYTKETVVHAGELHAMPMATFRTNNILYTTGTLYPYRFGERTIRYQSISDTTWRTIQNDTGRSATFGELQAVIPLSNGSNALFLSATQQAARTGQPGDTSVVTLAGLLLHNPETNTTTQPLVPPFHNQQWIYDVLPLGGDSVLVAIGSNIQFDGLPTPSLSSGTLWKGSLQTLEFREVFNGRTDAGNAYNYGWQFAKDSAGRIYASASSGGIVWSRDNGETWQDFDYENVKSWTIRDICIHKGMLFASTTKGLFRRELPTSVDVHDQDDVFLVQVSRRPNPAQNNVRLEFRGLDVLRSVPWSVTVVDVLGRPMAELTPALRQQTGSGTYQYDLDVSGWPTGVYVIGVQAAQYSRSFVVAVAR